MGKQPLPGAMPARDPRRQLYPGDGARRAAPPRQEDDWDGDAEMAAYIADLDAGRARMPEEWEIEGPAATISLGDAADVDLAELAAMVGPDGLGGEVFAQDRTADVMRPGPVLSALTEQAAGDLGRLTDNQVLGAMSAGAGWRRARSTCGWPRSRSSPAAARPSTRTPRRAGCRAAAGTGSSPTPSSAWNWSPRRTRPATRWIWRPTWKPGCPAPALPWPPG